VAEHAVDHRDDERLRQLLAVEQRLQALVQGAQADASRRIAAALAAIQTAHQSTLIRISAMADERVDELARWAAAQTIGETGEAT